MVIFDPLATMIRSNLNDLISRAENPEKMLNQLVLDMRSQLAKAKQQVATAIADEKKLQAQAEQEKKLAEDWEKRAMLAVQEGRDDLAKQALLRHAEHMQNAAQLDETWRKHAAETEQLKNSLRALNDKTAFETFERMTERIEDTERKALAAAELSEELEGDQLQRQFTQLEYKADADTQLLALKQRMGLLGPGKGEVHEAEIVEDEGEHKRGA